MRSESPLSRPLARLAGRATVAVLLAAGSAGAQAESLRCNGEIASAGESRLSLLRKCGEPMARDSFCKPVEVMVRGNPWPVVLPPHLAPCQIVDEWLYDRGPGNLYATVRFENGVIHSVRYEGRPR